jgi:hypothetical protein
MISGQQPKPMRTSFVGEHPTGWSGKMILTEDEKKSLSLAADERDRQVYMVYFEMKRCVDCNPRRVVEFRSCWPHVDKMVAIPTRKEWNAGNSV